MNFDNMSDLVLSQLPPEVLHGIFEQAPVSVTAAAGTCRRMWDVLQMAKRTRFEIPFGVWGVEEAGDVEVRVLSNAFVPRAWLSPGYARMFWFQVMLIAAVRPSVEKVLPAVLFSACFSPHQTRADHNIPAPGTVSLC